MKRNSINEIVHSKETFTTFYEDYSALVYSAIKYFCRNEDIYDEIATEALNELYYCLPKYDAEKSLFTTFTFSIVKNVVARFQKRISSYSTIHLDLNEIDQTTAIGSYFFRFSLLKTFLTEQEYIFIYELYVMNYSIKKVAQEKKINYSTAKHFHKQILKKLKPYLEVLMK